MFAAAIKMNRVRKLYAIVFEYIQKCVENGSPLFLGILDDIIAPIVKTENPSKVKAITPICPTSTSLYDLSRVS